MKKFTLFIFLMLFACAYAVAQTEEQQQQQPPEQQMPAQEQMPAQQQQQSPLQQNQQLTGVVQKIDLQKKTITIRDEITKTSQELNFSDTTTFTSGGQAAAVSQLKEGDRVALEVDSQNIATSIQIQAPEATPPPQPEKQ